MAVVRAGIRLARAVALLGVAFSCGACGACGSPAGAPDAAVNAAPIRRLAAPPDAALQVVRDAAMWARAKEGATEDLASLAVHEGGAGLVEAAAEPELRATALRAMGFARGWVPLPFVGRAATGDDETEAQLALDAALALAVRPRRAEDVEDADELQVGCEALLGLATHATRPRARRIGAIRILRMLPCPPAVRAAVPTDLDAR